MNTDIHQGSAKIYQFPTRLRTVVADHRAGATGKHTAIQQSLFDAALDNCWYHDAAVKQSAISTKP